ncbi:putative TDP-N-acetylfucosamine:lipid II N-acetylfucosaminyltransferase [Vibrio chagasii]|nr:putative TDP-N-acetylfucosamine:lipid II N-acetylfucosaminyltransferase [Vibrio chagasii]
MNKNIEDVKILHLAPDEKFIDMALRSFSATGSQNDVIVFSDTSLKHVKSEVLRHASLTSYNKRTILSIMEKYDIIVMHSLFSLKFKFPKSVKVIWIGFGYDYYDLVDNIELLMPNTKAEFLSRTLKGRMKGFVKKHLMVDLLKRKIKSKFIERIDIFAPVLTREYDLISWSGKKPALSDWNYGTLEDDWSYPGVDRITGANVLLGNSATITCNHIDGLKFLSDQWQDHRVILPLSYGDSKYKKELKTYLSSRSDKFPELECLDDFMQFNDYIRLISSCSYAVMPHMRQQAVGNIFILMYMGCKVFLNRNNPVYLFLIESGAIVYSIEDLKNKESKQPLTNEQLEINRNFLKSYISRDVMLRKTNRLIESAMS